MAFHSGCLCSSNLRRETMLAPQALALPQQRGSLLGRFESAGAFSYLVPGSSASVLASASFIASRASLDAWGGQAGLSPFRNSGKIGRQGRASKIKTNEHIRKRLEETNNGNKCNS